MPKMFSNNKTQLKACSYKSCPNTNTNSDLTFFCFPLRDEEKCARWIKNSGCDDDNLKRKFLCEEHFDRKFLSRASRRTVLVGNAIPYPYKISERSQLNESLKLNEPQLYEIGTSSFSPEEDDDDDKEEEEEEQEMDKLMVAENSLKPENEKKSSVTKHHGQKNIKQENIDNTNNVTKRQKIYHDTIKSHNHSSEQSDTDNENHFEIDNTEHNSDITTFIFKGQEYIQMPKCVYLEQRQKLDDDLKKYKRIVNNLKALVNDIDSD